MHGVNLWEIKKGKTVLNAFVKIVSESNCRPNKLWVDQAKEFFNKLIQEWLENNDILMYSAHNKGKSVIGKRFLKTLKAKIYKKLTANFSKSYLSYLNKLIDQYNNTFHHYIIILIKKLLMLIILLWLKKLRRILKPLNLKLKIESKLLSIRIILVKVTL